MTPKTIRTPYSVLSRLVYDLVEQPQHVFFSIYDTIDPGQDDVEDSDVIQYPDLESPDPVIPGMCRLSINDPRFSPTLVLSDNLTNPTWKDILNTCNILLGQCQINNTGFLYDIIPGPEGIHELAFT